MTLEPVAKTGRPLMKPVSLHSQILRRGPNPPTVIAETHGVIP
jgi:hypothetical protein